MLVGQPVGEDGRRDRHDAARLVVDEVQHGLGLEALDEQQPRPVAQHPAEHGVEAVDVEEGQDPQHHVVAVHHRRLDGGHLLDVCQQRPMAEHRRAGPTRGAAGVEEGGELLGVGQRRHGAYDVRAEVVEGELTLAGRGAGDDDGRPGGVRVELGQRSAYGVESGLVGDHHPAAGVGDHPGELAGGRPGGDRYGDDLGPEDAEVGRHELDAVADGDHHALAGADAVGSETGREAGDLVLEPGPGERAAAALDEGLPVRHVVGSLGHQLGDVVARHVAILPQPGSVDRRRRDRREIDGARRRYAGRVTPSERPRRLNLQQRSALAGEAAAASAEVENALVWPSDPTAAAFFDVDNTVMQGASIFHFARGLYRRKFFTTKEIASAAWKQAYFRIAGVEDPEHVADARNSALSFIAGHTTAELEELGEEIFDEAMAHRVWPGTRALAQIHLDEGQRVWLVTAAPIEIATIIARRLGLTGAMGTVAEHVDGVYTGRLVGDLLHGPAKAEAIKALAAREGLDLARCSAYSDSSNDLPMLSLVGDPCAINPDARLRAHARAHGWRVHDYRTGRKAARVGFLGAAVAGAVTGAVAAGVSLRGRDRSA